MHLMRQFYQVGCGWAWMCFSIQSTWRPEVPVLLLLLLACAGACVIPPYTPLLTHPNHPSNYANHMTEPPHRLRG